MARQNVEKLAFNRGVISALGLARTDVRRVGLSAATQTNWMPRVLGPMSLRPGWEYISSTNGNAAARHLPFVFSLDDTAILEFTDSMLRVRVAETIVTRASVSTAFTNGTFDTDLNNWTDADEAGATSVWRTGGYMDLLGSGTNAAIRKQTLTVAGGDQNVEHAVELVVTQGYVRIRIGSTDGDDDFLSEQLLGPGYHSLAFTPTGANAYVRLFSRGDYPVLVSSCTIASSGAMALTTPYAAADLGRIRYDQSGDVVFCACKGKKRVRIERRGDTSWSVVDYQESNGPFRTLNTSPTTIAPSAISGEITLTASNPTFKSTSVGAQYQLTSTGQAVTKTITAENTYSDPIRVTGLTATRGFNVTVTGTWVATVKLQRSVGDVGNWVDVSSESYTTNQSKVYNDSLDNQEVYYRIGVATGDYTSGTAVASLDYAFGSITGVVRVTAYSSTTSATAIVIQALGGTDATSDWAEGAWSDRRGHPSSVVIHDGRLWWAGKDRITGSVSDSFDDFDPDYEGDAGPVNRTIGSGPVDVINWLFSTVRLFAGAELAEKVVRTSALDEPITPTNFSLKNASTYGSAGVDVIDIDGNAVFVARPGSRAMELTANSSATTLTEATTEDLTVTVPEILEPYVVRVAAQRWPDTRVHFVLSDGTVAILIKDRAEDVRCWIKVETDGTIEDVVVIPGAIGDVEDSVYYTVNRTINGSTVRYFEKWAHEHDCIGGTLNQQADSFKSVNQASSTTITGLSHLEGETVVVWANGKDLGTYTVSSGSITVSEAVTTAIVGLGYDADYVSVKLAYAAQGGTALNQIKRVDHIGLVLQNTHYQGLQYGSDANNLDDLPLVEGGVATDADTVWSTYDELSVPFDGTYDTDSRIHLRASAPRPCTVLAATISMTTHEKL